MKRFIFPIVLMVLPAVSYGAVTGVQGGMVKASGANVARAASSGPVKTTVVKKQVVPVNPARASSMSAISSTSGTLKVPGVNVKGATPPSPAAHTGDGISTAEFDSYRNSVDAELQSLWAIIDALESSEGKYVASTVTEIQSGSGDLITAGAVVDYVESKAVKLDEDNTITGTQNFQGLVLVDTPELPIF